MRNFLGVNNKKMGTPMTKSTGRMMACACAGRDLAWPAAAQDFPGGKPIEMTVMFGAGSAADVTARHLAEGMSKALGVPIMVVNRTGGGGAVGYAHVAQQKPDGFSIIWNSTSISTTYHSGKLDFDYRAFDPVARVSVETPVLAVRADAPWRTFKEFLDYAQSASGQQGAGRQLRRRQSYPLRRLGVVRCRRRQGHPRAVRGGPGGPEPARQSHRCHGAIAAGFVPQVRSGELRILAVLGSKPEPAFPGVPTAQELGYTAIHDMWRGIAVPKGTPRPVIAKLEDAIRQTVASAEFKQAGKEIGFTPAFLPAKEFGELMESDDRKLAEGMKELGLKKK